MEYDYNRGREEQVLARAASAQVSSACEELFVLRRQYDQLGDLIDTWLLTWSSRLKDLASKYPLRDGG